ncbi:MAG: DUF3089 domain-containing protein [Ruminococcus sp.]
MKKLLAILLSAILAGSVVLGGCSAQPQSAVSETVVQTTQETTALVSENSKYADKENWAYFENEESDKKADVFFLCPTVYGGSQSEYNMSLGDDETKENFLGATNMEKGIYDDECRFFAPYYRQIGLAVYAMSEEVRTECLETAFEDVKESFEYYMQNCNNGRPIIIAGFSQGADMSIRLIKECFADEQRQKQLVACYAIGWRFTEEEVSEYPQLKAAQGESDTGVVISFNSEAESVSSSLMVPQGIKTLSINPLNWKTDSTRADKSENLGACFTDYSGNITSEIANLTGAYIDSERGTLRVTDISSEDYPSSLDIMGEGVYHIYDYQFFYRNLEKNVQTRLNAYLNAE